MVGSKNGGKVFSALIDVFFIIICITMIVPFLMLVAISISNETDVALYGYKLIPMQIDFSAYKYVFKNPSMVINAYKVTIFTSFFGTFLSVFLMSLIAYPLSVKSFKYRKFVSLYVFFTMIFSGGLVSSYILITRYLRLNNKIWVFIFPTLINAWYVIMLRTFFQGIPDAMIEAAEIDGASQYRIFFTMILPLSKPVIATVALLELLVKWNDWYSCMLYITDNALVTLQYLLQSMLQNIQLLQQMQEAGVSVDAKSIPSETVRMAMAVIVAGPMVLIFPFFQKYFTKVLTVGSVKG